MIFYLRIKHQLVLTLLLICSSLLYAQNNCNHSGIGQIIGLPQGDERGSSIVETAEKDGYYLVGLKDDSIRLFKYTNLGMVLWTKTFDVAPDEADHVFSMILDSDGMLAMAGNSGNEPTSATVFALRYNPHTHEILWARNYSNAEILRGHGIIQKNNGGNYVIFNTSVYTNSQDFSICELDLNDGHVIGQFTKEYHLGSAEGIAELVHHEEFLYGIGRFTDPDAPAGFRNTLIKMNQEDATLVWVKLGHVPGNQSARLYGWDILIHDNTIYTGCYGDPNGSSTTNTKLYIQRTSLDGELIWLKQYELPGSNDVGMEILDVGDGILMYAATRANNGDIILFKVDYDGDLLWKRKIVFSDFITSIANLDSRISNIIQIDNQIIFTGWAQNEFGGNSMFVVHTDLEGNIDLPCVFSEDVEVSMIEITNPVFYELNPIVRSINIGEISRDPLIINSDFVITEQCLAADSVIIEISESICSGESFEGYSESGVYTDEFISVNGCDSIRILTLTVLPLSTSEINVSVCDGDFFEGYGEPGTYTDTFPTNEGCDSIRILHLQVISCLPIVAYDLEACQSYMHNGTNMDYSEFVPEYPNPLSCAEVSASIVFRSNPQENKHSCTPGVNNTTAMCVSAHSGCTYIAGHEASVVIEVNINPATDSIARLTGLQFYEKAPATYNWIDGPSGPNNYPRRYGIRVLKNGTEIYREESILTSLDWSLQDFQFAGNDLFRTEEQALFRIELFPYCPVGNGALVSAWDIDQIRIFGGCEQQLEEQPFVDGFVHARNIFPLADIQIHSSNNNQFTSFTETLTDQQGYYSLANLTSGEPCFVQAYYNEGTSEGVSTLDLIHLQRHILGISPFNNMYQVIAADINKNGVINVLDMLDLRKLLLGHYTEFPRNTSWRFGVYPQEMNGTDINAFKETHQIETLTSDPLQLNFTGIKVGDINNDIILNGVSQALSTRSSKDVTFNVVAENTNDGYTYLHLSSDEALAMEGLQFAALLPVAEGVQIKHGILPLDEEFYSLTEEGLLRVSWNTSEPVDVVKDAVLFSIMIPSSQWDVENFSLLNEVLQPELYKDGGVEPSTITFRHTASNVRAASLHIQPNPFRTELNIRFTLPEDGNATLTFYDVSGRIIYNKTGEYRRGDNHERLATADFPGIVYCRLVSGDTVETQKLIRL